MPPLTPALTPVAGQRGGVRGLPRRGLFFRAKSREKHGISFDKQVKGSKPWAGALRR